MFNKTVCRIVSVFVFALFVQIGFGQFVGTEVALERVSTEIDRVEDVISQANTVTNTGSFQASQEASLTDVIYLKALTQLESDISNMKSVDEAMTKVVDLQSGQTDATRQEVLTVVIERLENLLS